MGISLCSVFIVSDDKI